MGKTRTKKDSLESAEKHEMYLYLFERYRRYGKQGGELIFLGFRPRRSLHGAKSVSLFLERERRRRGKGEKEEKMEEEDRGEGFSSHEYA